MTRPNPTRRWTRCTEHAKVINDIVTQPARTGVHRNVVLKGRITDALVAWRCRGRDPACFDLLRIGCRIARQIGRFRTRRRWRRGPWTNRPQNAQPFADGPDRPGVSRTYRRDTPYHTHGKAVDEHLGRHHRG